MFFSPTIQHRRLRSNWTDRKINKTLKSVKFQLKKHMKDSIRSRYANKTSTSIPRRTKVEKSQSQRDLKVSTSAANLARQTSRTYHPKMWKM